MADLTGDLTTQAVEPASSSSDGQSATARPVADIIAAQQFLDAKSALTKRRRGIAFSKLVPPGTLPDEGRTGNLGSFNSPGGY